MKQIKLMTSVLMLIISLVLGTVVPIGNLAADVSAAEDDPVKILAIGNSFSVDATQYLYEIVLQCGVKNLIIGNLEQGGATLAIHRQNAEGNLGNYTYNKDTDNKWIATKGATMEQGIKD